MTIYAIGDIHGQRDMLVQALDRIVQDGWDDARIVFLGDYIDRGTKSRAVLDDLIAGRDAGKPWIFIKGNHDRMFAWFMQDHPKHDPFLAVDMSWLHPRLGGDMTLASYGVDFTPKTREIWVHEQAKRNVPEHHIAFLNSLQLFYETDELFFAHAGIRPQVPLADQTEHDMLWIRQEFHAYTAPHPKLVVHGHSPIETATHYGNRVNLDTGAGSGRALTVAVFEGKDVAVLTEQGRVPLRPA